MRLLWRVVRAKIVQRDGVARALPMKHLFCASSTSMKTTGVWPHRESSYILRCANRDIAESADILLI